MQYAVVLHVGAVADAYVEHVAAHDAAEPNRRLLTDVNVTNHLGAVGDEGRFVNLRMNAAKRSNHRW